jgi:enoyl-CoA hydratase
MRWGVKPRKATMRAGHADDVGAVLLTGTGGCFSAGLDLRQLSESGPRGMRLLLLTLNRTLLTLFSYPGPLVGALNGHAIAGGLMLAMCCDYRVAPRERCKIGLTEVRVGVSFPIAGLEIVRSELDAATLRHLAQIGRNIDAKEAHRRGVVNELHDAASVLPRAIETAADLARVPRAAYVGTKHQLRGDAIERIKRWVDASDDPAMPIWTDPATVRGAAAILEDRGQE